jgi:hypothetical protein
MPSMKKRLSLTLMLLLLPSSLNAEYTDSCALYAQMLWSAASSYDSAKSSFESACDPYIGYSKNDKSACGSYGYIRSPYESAKRELKDALNNVALFCGPCDGLLASFMRESKKNSKNLESEIDRLKKRLLELEAENEALNKKIKPTQ